MIWKSEVMHAQDCFNFFFNAFWSIDESIIIITRLNVKKDNTEIQQYTCKYKLFSNKCMSIIPLVTNGLKIKKIKNAWINEGMLTY